MRRKAAPKRDLLPDPKYGSEFLTKFINHLMESGKRSLAERIVYGALSTAEEKLKGSPIDTPAATTEEGEEGEGGSEGGMGSAGTSLPRPLLILQAALNNVRPAVEVKARRVGGATYQIPIEVPANRGRSLAMRWMINAAKSRREKTMMLRLAAEIVDAFNGTGVAVKKRDDTHRMARANQAFAHYRW